METVLLYVVEKNKEAQMFLWHVTIIAVYACKTYIKVHVVFSLFCKMFWIRGQKSHGLG